MESVFLTFPALLSLDRSLGAFFQDYQPDGDSASCTDNTFYLYPEASLGVFFLPAWTYMRQEESSTLLSHVEQYGQE